MLTSFLDYLISLLYQLFYGLFYSFQLFLYSLSTQQKTTEGVIDISLIGINYSWNFT